VSEQITTEHQHK